MFFKKTIFIFFVLIIGSCSLLASEDNKINSSTSLNKTVKNSFYVDHSIEDEKIKEKKLDSIATTTKISEEKKKIAARLDLIYVMMLAFAFLVIVVFAYYVLSMYFGRKK